MFLATSITQSILLVVGILLVVSLLLILVLLFVKEKLAPSGPVKIKINGEKEIEVASGDSLLTTLSAQKIFLPSACGGGGTCIQCECHVKSGGGEALPTETPHFTRKELQSGARLACQVKVKQDMDITIPEEVFGIKKWEATVVSNYNVASFIKEFVVRIPEDMDYKAGGYIQIDIPESEINFSDMDITAHPEEHDSPDKFKSEWDNFKLWPLVMKNSESVERAYSMASFPAEGRDIMLNVRIATPPPALWNDVPPGKASSYIYSLKAGDPVTISGPYGEFFIKDTDREMVYIGGGAGMAPMRSHLFHLFHTLKTGRKVSFWYGARSLREMFYDEEFKKIADEFPNFTYNVALSEPMPEDNWTGPTGFIHQVAHDNYLSNHEDPTEIEYYMCGPPPMIKAVEDMLDDLGVEKEMIAFDSFG